VGLAIFTQVGAHTGYLLHVMPAEFVVSIGMGTAFVPLSSTALVGVDAADAGVASALVNTTQQIGGSLGVALLNTIAASATTSYLLGHGTSPAVQVNALVHGYTTAFTVSAVLLAAAAVVSVLVLRASRHDVVSQPEELPAQAA